MLVDDGSLYSWGDPNYNRIGRGGPNDIPQNVTDLPGNAVKVSVGSYVLVLQGNPTEI